MFVTRDEFNYWMNVDGATVNGTTGGLVNYLNKMELVGQEHVQGEVRYEMYKRNLRLPETLTPEQEESLRNRYASEYGTPTQPSSSASTDPTSGPTPGYIPISWSSTQDPKKWMSVLPGDRYLSEVNMPGTHDSGMCYATSGNTLVDLAKSFALTQNTTIESQLNMGVRFFDIRLDDDANLYVCHGNGGTKFTAYKETGLTNKMTFKYVLDTITTFLNTNNNETVVVCVNCEDGNKTTCANNIKTLINTYSNIETGSSFKKLSELRGKIVLVTRISGEVSTTGGINFTGISDNTSSTKVVNNVEFYIEDHYDATIENKKTYINNAFTTCGNNTIDTSSEKTSKSALIFTSAYNGASNNPQSMANTINPYISGSDITLTQGKAYGWVLFNYVNGDLCKKIWETNP